MSLDLSREYLLNKEVKVIISEPWGFTFPGKKNATLAEIKQLSSANSEAHWIILEVEPFVYKNCAVSEFCFLARYESQTDIVQELLNVGYTTGFFVFSTVGESLADNLQQILSEEGKTYSWFIGSIESVDDM